MAVPAVPAVPRGLHPLDLLHACCFTGAIFHSFAVNIGELAAQRFHPSVASFFRAAVLPRELLGLVSDDGRMPGEPGHGPMSSASAL